MLSQQELEETVRQAVKDFAASMSPNRKIVADMTPLTAATAQIPLLKLDYWERFIWREFEYISPPKRQSKWKIWPDSPVPLTWLDICSRDGYRRERALRTLTGAAPNRLFFAFVVRRLNDWVPQVRAAARDAIFGIAKATDQGSVTDVLYMSLFRWHSWRRMEESDKAVLLKMISEEDISISLKEKIERSTSGPSASILAQVGRTSVFDTYLSEISSISVQPSVRAKAYRSQLEGRMTWTEGRKWVWTDKRYCEGRLNPVISERRLTLTVNFPEVLRSASRDRSPIVRRVAAEMLIRHFADLGDEALSMANYFAADASPSIAEQGRFALKQIESQANNIS